MTTPTGAEPRFELLTFGEVMAAFLADDGLPLSTASRFRLTAAGCEANVAATAARLGHRVGYVTRVGDDGLGAGVLARLRATGVHVVAATDPEAGTGVLVRDVSADRPTEVAYARRDSAGSRLGWHEVRPVLEQGTTLLFVSGITAVLSQTCRDACMEAARWARTRGCLLLVDPNLRRRLSTIPEARRVVRPLTDLADVVVAGRDELDALYGDAGPSPERKLLDGGARLVVVTHGPGGSEAFDPAGGHWRQPAAPVRAVDPVGAGDAFTGALVSAQLRGLDVAASLAEAAVVAAAVVATPGDIDGLPSGRQRDSWRPGAAVER